jgi:hypothetical protein
MSDVAQGSSATGSVTPAAGQSGKTDQSPAGKQTGSQAGSVQGPAKGAAQAPKGNSPAAAAGVRGGSEGNEPKQAQDADTQGQKDAEEAEFEEVNLGGKKFRVQKGLTDNLKQWERAVQVRMEQAAKREKEIVENLKKNPREVLKKMGVDVRGMSEQELVEHYKRQAMTPEQQELEDTKARLAEYEAKEKERQEQEKQRERTEKEQKEDMQLRTGMLEALGKSSLPEDAYFAARTAATMMQAQAQGLSWTWDQCVARVERDFKDSLRQIVSKLDPQGIQELLGDEPLKKWRQFDVSRVSSPLGSQANAPEKRPGAMPASGNASQSNGPRKSMSEREFLEFMGGI